MIYFSQEREKAARQMLEFSEETDYFLITEHGSADFEYYTCLTYANS